MPGPVLGTVDAEINKEDMLWVFKELTIGLGG